MNSTETQIQQILKKMKSEKKYIALSLNPAIGNTIITAEDNRMFINEGRHGQFENVSEAFYDSMVLKYDSRVARPQRY